MRADTPDNEDDARALAVRQIGEMRHRYETTGRVTSGDAHIMEIWMTISNYQLSKTEIAKLLGITSKHWQIDELFRTAVPNPRPPVVGRLGSLGGKALQLTANHVAEIVRIGAPREPLPCRSCGRIPLLMNGDARIPVDEGRGDAHPNGSSRADGACSSSGSLSESQ
jgi:hypothetical protein